MKSGATRYHNQVQWARQYLVWEGLLGSTKRGIWNLTEKGFEMELSEDSAREIFLKWVKIHALRRKKKTLYGGEVEIAHGQEIDEELSADPDHDELISLLKSFSPDGFERFITHLLLEMGFDRAENTQMSRDGGIDGYGLMRINEFISFRVVYQCKRLGTGKVSRSDVGDFRNAMMGRADKGIIFTTSSFSRDAEREANREGVPPVELVDVDRLVSIVQDAQFGVSPEISYVIDEQFMQRYMPD